MDEDDEACSLAWLEESQRLLWEDQKAYELWLDSLAKQGLGEVNEDADWNRTGDR